MKVGFVAFSLKFINFLFWSLLNLYNHVIIALSRYANIIRSKIKLVIKKTNAIVREVIEYIYLKNLNSKLCLNVFDEVRLYTNLDALWY